VRWGGGVIAWLKLVPSWVWPWVAAVVLALVVGGGQQLRVLAAQSATAIARGATSKAQADLANYRTEVAERDRRAALAELAEARRRLAVDEQNRKKNHEELEQAQADAAAADRIAGGLRAELNRIRGLIASYSGAPDGSTAGRSTADLLADLLEEVEREGRAMAAEADRRGVAGAMCERAYDGVRGD